MATKTSQRVFIWVIAIVMTVGTIAGFIAMMLAPTNQKIDDAAAQRQQEEYLAQIKKQQEEYRKTLKPLEGYEATSFDASAVSELKIEVLKEGDGTAAKSDSTVNANYFGWTSDGKIFDSTNKNGTTTPIDFGLDQVIKGWTEGLTGVKAGSVVKLTIPADKAYGSVDNGTGQPTGPLVFIVEIVAVK